MNITIEKEILDSAVTMLTGVTSKNNTIAAMAGIQFKVENGSCVLSGFDNEKGMRIKLEADIKEEGCYVIDAQRLSQIVKTMPGDMISIEVDSNKIAKIYSGKSEFQLSVINGEDFPNLPELDGEIGFNIKRAELSEMIKRAGFAVGVNNPRPELNGLRIEISGNTIKAIACDSNRVALLERVCTLENHDEGSIEAAFTIPTKTLPELQRLLGDSEDSISIRLGRKHIMFSYDDTIFFTRLLDKEFIEYNRFIPHEFAISVDIDSEELRGSLERALLITENTQKGEIKTPLRCRFEGDKLIITTQSSSGRVYDEIDIVKTGDDIEIGFNCRFLLDAIRSCDDGMIRLSINSPLMGIVVRAVEEDETNKYLFLVLPLRLPK